MNLLMRVRLRLLWIKHAYTFHWSHKPLCDRFRKDVVRIGAVHLCRSCVCAYAGIFTGIVFAFAASVPTFPFLAILCSVILFSAPPLYKRLPRSVRDLLRFATGMLIPLSIDTLLTVNPWAGLFGLLAITAFWLVYFKLRRSRKLRECNGCPELAAPGICSGFTRQADHVRQYERAATGLLMATGYKPECLPNTSLNKGECRSFTR